MGIYDNAEESQMSIPSPMMTAGRSNFNDINKAVEVSKEGRYFVKSLTDIENELIKIECDIQK